MSDILDDLAGFMDDLGEAVSDAVDGAIEVMDEVGKALDEVGKAGDRIFGTDSDSSDDGSIQDAADERTEKYNAILEASVSLLGSIRELEKASGEDIGSGELEEIISELKEHSPMDKELDELLENNADELFPATKELVDGMGGLMAGFREVEALMKEDGASGDEAGSKGESAEEEVSIYVSAGGKSAEELSKLSLYTWNDAAVRGTSALSGGDGWESTCITPERAEDGLAVFRLGIVHKGEPFSFIVRTEGNAVQSADFTAKATGEPVFVSWDAAAGGQGSALQAESSGADAAEGKVSIYVNAAGKSAEELSGLSLYTWNDDGIRGTSALSVGEDGWSSTRLSPEHTEDGLAVFRLDIVHEGAPFSFIVRTRGNDAQSADLSAKAAREPVLVTWDAAESGKGSASQLSPAAAEDIAGEVKARTESLFSGLKAALK
ncbi:MAG: hypothetical protein SPL41_11975 [Succinivibrionaceae bacterium]|nr:hypothetical protein [Succinivibrionaceae bacterium]MDY6376458.1 hypothetical protein [Succinivibrionaceae bacterium]